MAYRYSLVEENTSNGQLLISQDDPPATPSMQTSFLDKKADFNILEKLKNLRDNKKFCDVVLEVRGVQFVAHKNILASWSPTFAAKLFGDNQNVFKDYITVYYDNCEVFSDLLDFMYNGYVAPRETNFLQLLHLAVSFQIETLKSYCEEFLRCNLHLGNFVSTYFLSRKFKLEALEEYIVGFLQLNLSDAVKQGEFLSLRAEKFNTFLSEGWMKKIKPEIKLFLIISWVGYDVGEREKYLVLLLGHINWSTVANDFLLEINRTENFFTSHESSLYLLLQTLYSASIPLGPYKDAFPALRETHSAILKEVVQTTLLKVNTEEFYPVRIDVRARPTFRDASVNTFVSTVHLETREIAINTDVNSRHFEETDMMETNVEVPPAQNTPIEQELPKAQDLKYDPFETLGELIEAEIHEIKQRENQERLNKGTETLEEQRSEQRTEQSTTILEDRQTNITVNTDSPPLTETQLSPVQSGRKTSKRRNRSANVNDTETPKKKTVANTPAKQPAIPVKAQTQKTQTPKTRKSPRQPKPVQTNYIAMLDKLHDWIEEGRTEAMHIPETNEKDPDFEPNDPDEIQMIAVASKIKSGEKAKPKRKSRTTDSEKTDDNVSGPALMCTYEGCAYITKFQQRMDRHVKVAHEVSFELKCNLCQFESKEVRKYHNHMKQHFPGPPFKCDFPRCTYTGEKIKELLKHRCSHTDERPFTCDCGMRFRTNNTLIAHKKVHLGEKRYKCDECDQSFATQNTLNQHKVRHSDVRPYLCHECGFSTKFQSHLISHKRIHSGEVFHCQFPNCTYSSPKRSQLKGHMRAHLGIRAHICEVCSKAFVERSHLVRHQKIHNNVRIECTQCPYSTTRQDKLKEHIKKHHSTEAVNKAKKGAGVKKKNEKVSDKTTENDNDPNPPEIVKWDHGCYSLSQEQEDPNTETGDGLLNGEGEYCVLRDSLSNGAPLQQMLTVEQIDGQMTISKSLDTSSIVTQHSGILQDAVHVDVATLNQAHSVSGMTNAVPVLSLLNSPMTSVDPTMVVNKPGNSEAPQQTFIIEAHPSQNNQQAEYTGLNAFMAFIE